jgi:ATP-dependent exoDNAse (exonuclease V) beta subunit
MNPTAGEDAAARRDSLETSRSIVLQAPAGSGKTTVLVARYLALLATATVPEEILAITFTRRAAVEMRNRVLMALRAADAGCASAPSAVAAELHALATAVVERDRHGNWNLRAQPSRLRIETIDALNQRLAGQSPVLSRGAALPPIAANPGVLYRRAARRTLQAVVEEPALAAHATLLFERLDNRWGRVESLLADLLGRRAQWLPVVLADQPHVLVQRALSCVQGIILGELRLAVALMPPGLRADSAAVLAQMARHRQGDPAAATPEAAAWIEADTLTDSPDDLARWRFLCATAMTAKGEWRQKLNKLQGVPADDGALKARARQWLEQLQSLPGALTRLRAIESLPDAALESEERAVLLALPLLLRRAAAELELTFAAAGEVDFTAVAAAARQSLVSRGEPTDLALRLGAAVHHILVDEFQDTSAEQLDLLCALTAGWQAGEPRSLFVVGDPMQSIYQFRDAEVGLFLQVRERGLGGLPLQARQLRNNFRSAPELVDWVNERLGPLFPVQDDVRQSAVRFLSSTAARTQLTGQVQIHPSLNHDPIAEAQQVLAIIHRVRREKPDATIAVLVASRRHATVIGGALEQGGVPIRAVRITPLADRAVVRDLLALTRAVQHAGDRTAWLSLLRSPLAGLELPELQQLAEDRHELLPAAIERHLAAETFDAETSTRLRRVIAALRPALAGVELLLPLASRIERAWLRLGGVNAYAGTPPLADAQRFFAALAADRGAADLTGEDLAPFIDDLYATAAGGEGAVEILTMHGAKGLEWDVVIVPGLGLTSQSDTQPLLDCFLLPTDRGDTELLLGTVEATAQRNEQSLGSYIRYLRNERRRLEQIRLLYVTATRARLELHWLGAARITRKGEMCAAAGSLLAALWPSFEREFAALAAQAQSTMPPAPGPRARVAALLRLPADFTLQSGASPPVSRLPVAATVPPAQPEYRWVGRGARAVGTIVHAELQRLAGAQDPTHPRATQVLPAPEHYGAWLAQLGVASGERRAAGERINAALRRTLADPRGLWLLNGALHEEAHSERRLTGLVDGQLVDLVIDRMLVSEGIRWVVDFKTGTHLGGDLDAFIDAEVQRYRPQLRRYATLAAQLGPQAVRCALYFPLLGRFQPLEL